METAGGTLMEIALGALIGIVLAEVLWRITQDAKREKQRKRLRKMERRMFKYRVKQRIRIIRQRANYRYRRLKLACAKARFDLRRIPKGVVAAMKEIRGMNPYTGKPGPSKVELLRWKERARDYRVEWERCQRELARRNKALEKERDAEWVDINKQLPEHGQQCWVAETSSGHVWHVRFVNEENNDNWYFVCGAGIFRITVTHWQPLKRPEPPRR